MTSLHSDSYNENLLFARRLDEGNDGGSPSGENPQEASSTPNTGNLNNPLLSRSSPSDPKDDNTFIKQYLSRIITAIIALGMIGVVFVLLPYNAVHAASKDHWNEALYWSSGTFVLIAVPVSVHGIVQHLVNYYMPQVQKYVIRILFMVPIFSIQAWFSLFFHGASQYIRAFRELYEAFVLSSFVYYIIELLGGEDELALKLRTKDPSYGHHGLLSKLFGTWQMGRQFMLNCKYGVLQYVLVKIIATVVVIALKATGNYNEGDWSVDSAYLYIAITMNFSIGYALYCLVKLYYATKVDLKEWNPVWKFLCIKGIIFFTFWQGFLIEVLHSFGVIGDVGEWDSEHVVDGIQDYLISFEMVLFAIAHRYAFPHTDYIHYLRRHKHSRGSRRSPDNSVQSEEHTLLFDQDHNVVNDPRTVDVEYEPPTVRQLDRPMSVSRALLGVVPNETFSDIARMSMSGSVMVGEGAGRGGTARGSRVVGDGAGDIVFSREHAEGI